MTKKTKRCSHCHKWKPVSEFNKTRSEKDGLYHRCKTCTRESNNQSRYRLGKRQPLGTNPNCSCFLGVHVAERVLAHVYQHVEQMPYGHPGYDFICGRGFRIDVKSSCRRRREKQADSWEFTIGKNNIADYFLCLAFDDRESLNPEHVWLLPGSEFNHLVVASITESRLGKWSEFELHEKLEQVVSCCNIIKESA